MRSSDTLSTSSSPSCSLKLSSLALILLLGACDDTATPSIATPGESETAPSIVSGPDSSTMAQSSLLTLTLPFSGLVASTSPGFQISQFGGGIAGRFYNVSTGSSQIALEGLTNGVGHAIRGWNNGMGRAGVFLNSNTANPNPALEVIQQGGGMAALFSRSNQTTTRPAVIITSSAPGTALLVDHRDPTCTSTQTNCNLAVFQASGVNKIRFGRGGKGYFALGTVTGGADLAEAFEVEGAVSDYEPGDVLVISLRSDRKVERSDEAYSTRLVGVYATQPGVLLTNRDIDDPMTDMVPLGVVGVIPAKVSAVNGPIRRGDLLVTSGDPGYAMRGTDHRRMNGAILGRALQEFKGPGKGMIQVMVSVR